MITTKKDYKLDLANQTLTITAAFAEAANNPGSKEYRLVRQLQHDFPNLRIEHRTHASPKKYTNSNGRITTHNQYKKLTYGRMEQFMSVIDTTAFKSSTAISTKPLPSRPQASVSPSPVKPQTLHGPPKARGAERKNNDLRIYALLHQ